MPPKNVSDSTVYYKKDGEMVPLEVCECPELTSIGETLPVICAELGKKLISIIKPFVETLEALFGNLEPYVKYEMLHPRKKPRGSIRRRKRSRR